MIKMDAMANSELDYIVAKTPSKELYYQLAEEACELAQAALKVNRAINLDNPASISLSEAHRNLIEEYTDLILIADIILGLEPKVEIAEAKTDRWYQRLRNAKEGNTDGHNKNHTDVDR